MNGQQIGVAACLDLARLGPGRSHISRFVSFRLGLGDKFLHRSIVQVRIFVLDSILVGFIVFVFGIVAPVQRLILVFQEVRVIRELQVAILRIHSVFVVNTVIVALFVPCIIHLEDDVTVDTGEHQQHNRRHYNNQGKDGEQDPFSQVFFHECTNLIIIFAVSKKGQVGKRQMPLPHPFCHNDILGSEIR